MWGPRTSSTSRDQAILVDQITDASLSSDAVLLKIDRVGQRFQRRRRVQGTVRPVLVMAVLVRAQDLPQIDADTISRPNGTWINTIRWIQQYVPKSEHYRVALPGITGSGQTLS